MKKLLQGAIVLFLFAASISLIEISCSKSNGQANRPQSPTTGKIIFGRYTGTGPYEIWSANYDGSNAAAIPISLPADVYLVANVDTKGAKVSPDGTKLFFLAAKTINNYQQVSIYSCNIDGSNPQLIVQGNGGVTADILEVYQAF